jgi:hypothetical protein
MHLLCGNARYKCLFIHSFIHQFIYQFIHSFNDFCRRSRYRKKGESRKKGKASVMLKRVDRGADQGVQSDNSQCGR